MIGALVALELVTFHMVDGRTVLVNPAAVQQLYYPTKGGNKLVNSKAKCVIRMTSNYVSVLETCEQVKQMLEGEKP